MLLEVKSCTLVKANTALFPDAPTQRGREQIKILINAVKEGFSAMILFVVQREDASNFRPNEEIDPLFVKHLNQGLSQGLLLSYIRCSYKPPQTFTYLDFQLLS
jgi:sugar fermentation stimulation protein A